MNVLNLLARILHSSCVNGSSSVFYPWNSKKKNVLNAWLSHWKVMATHWHVNWHIEFLLYVRGLNALCLTFPAPRALWQMECTLMSWNAVDMCVFLLFKKHAPNSFSAVSTPAAIKTRAHDWAGVSALGKNLSVFLVFSCLPCHPRFWFLPSLWLVHLAVITTIVTKHTPICYMPIKTTNVGMSA